MIRTKQTVALFLVTVASLACEPGKGLCKDCPPSAASECPPAVSSAGATAGMGGAGGDAPAPDVMATLTHHRTCGPGPLNPCTGTGGVPPFACTQWDGCYTAGSSGQGHCRAKLLPGGGAGAGGAPAKCITGARMACTTHTAAKGVYVCDATCDWPNDGCTECGTNGKPCCVDGCGANLKCKANLLCEP